MSRIYGFYRCNVSNIDLGPFNVTAPRKNDNNLWENYIPFLSTFKAHHRILRRILCSNTKF